MLASLHANGYASVRDWGIDVVALRQQAEAAFEKLLRELKLKQGLDLKKTGYPKLNFNPPLSSLPALEPLLRNSSTARVVNDYLGGAARFDGASLLRLTDNTTTENNANALWHHDRCGRRLKAFIFLNDVEIDGRPTVVARGSHNTLYYR